jgi:hypothetical protein
MIQGIVAEQHPCDRSCDHNNESIQNLDEVKFMNTKWKNYYLSSHSDNYVMSSFRDEEWIIEIL